MCNTDDSNKRAEEARARAQQRQRQPDPLRGRRGRLYGRALRALGFARAAADVRAALGVGVGALRRCLGSCECGRETIL